MQRSKYFIAGLLVMVAAVMGATIALAIPPEEVCSSVDEGPGDSDTEAP